MNLFTRAAILMFLLTGCELGDVVSMTIDQRESQVVPGLDLSRQVSIHIGDIESNDLIHRTPEIEELEVTARGRVLVSAEDVRVGDRLTFQFDGGRYEISIDSLHTHLVWDDEVDLTVERLR